MEYLHISEFSCHHSGEIIRLIYRDCIKINEILALIFQKGCNLVKTELTYFLLEPIGLKGIQRLKGYENKKTLFYYGLVFKMEPY